MRKILKLILKAWMICALLAPSTAAPACSAQSGHCAGEAFDFSREVSRSDCLALCRATQGCSHYSHNSQLAGPHRAHCYLYTAINCDQLETERGWVTASPACHHRLSSSNWFRAS